MLVLITAL